MIDVSGLSYFLPIFTFLFSFLVIFAILAKTKIMGDNAFTQASISFVISLILISFSGVRSYIEQVTPWFVVLVVALFFIVFMAAFALKKPEDVLKPGLAWVFVVVLVVIFLFIGYGHFHVASNHDFVKIKNFLFDEKIGGSVLLLIVALIAGIAVTRK